MRRDRLLALDHLRGFVIALVVLHHSVLAYCTFGHFDRLHYLWSTAPIVDGSKWLGFDLIVLFNDAFFMPLLFLLSGLFVWPSLARKGGMAYCRDRLSRIGLPFAVAVATVIPLAWYPSFRLTGGDIDFGEFWVLTVFAGPWPSGPAWFLGVLLVFDFTAALVYRFVRPMNDTGEKPRPAVWFRWLVALSMLAYMPLLLLAGPTRWLSFGPFAVQASRIGLYGVYFLAGVVAGRHGLGRLPAEAPRRRWPWWSLVAVSLFVCLVGVQTARLTGWLVLPASAWLSLYGANLVLFCASANFTFFAIFLRFAQRPVMFWDSLAVNSYGIYLLHYPIVTWMQFVLLDVRIDAILKAVVVFAAALCISWASTIALRRVPGAARII